MPRKMLIANDGSDGAAKALTAATALAKQAKGELHMVCVEELPRFPASIEEVIEEKQEANHRFTDVMAKAIAEAKSHHINLATHLLAGHAVPCIVEAIEQHHFDLLVEFYGTDSAL